jgi:hypothetical protein
METSVQRSAKRSSSSIRGSGSSKRIQQNSFAAFIIFISIISLLKDSLSKNNYTKNKTANDIDAKNGYNYLKFSFNNLLENFKFDQFINLEILLKEYIIQIIYIIIAITIAKITNKILPNYLYILVKNLLKKSRNWKEFQSYLFKKIFIINSYMEIRNLNNY